MLAINKIGRGLVRIRAGADEQIAVRRQGASRVGARGIAGQRKAVGLQSQSVRNKTHQSAGKNNDETGATGSSSPRYAPAPK